MEYLAKSVLTDVIRVVFTPLSSNVVLCLVELLNNFEGNTKGFDLPLPS